MNCIDVQILEPLINTIEVETCIDNQDGHVEIIEYKEANIEINHCISLIDFYNHNHGNITKDGAIGSSGNYIVVTGNSGVLKAVQKLEQSQINSIYGNSSISGDLVYVLNRTNHSGTQLSNTISDFNSAVSGIVGSKFGSISGISGVTVSNNNANYTISLSDPTVQLSDITDLSLDARIFLSTPTSNNLAALVTNETGSGNLVFSNGPTLSIPNLITPILGAATATTINKVQILSSSGAVLDIASNKTLKTNNSVIFTGIDNSIVNYGSGGNIAYQDSPNFSGIPTVPTAASGTNTNQIASTAFVRTEINNNIGSNLVIANVSGLQAALDSKQPSGNYASSSHTHVASNITNFNSSVSGLLPVKNVIGSGYVNVVSTTGNYTVYVTGIQPLLNNPITGVGNSGYIARWTSNNTIGSGLIYDDSSVVYIRNLTGETATSQVSISGYKSLQTLESSDMGFGFSSINFKTPSRNAYINFYGSNTIVPAFQNKLIISSSGGLGIYSSIVDINNPAFSISESGNIGIGKYNASVALDVIGTGNFSQNLLINNVPVSVSGHTHTSSNIIDFNTSVSGLINGIYAPLNSPTLTGIPLAPTATSGTNTNQIASTAFVRTEISNLVSSSPSTLDTLNELAAALGNDANFSTTVTNNLAGKANLNGATFTGSISGPSGDFTNLRQNGVIVSVSGHAHTINDVGGLQTALDNKQPSGNYAPLNHSHTASNITDFNSSVSGLLPVKNILAGYDIDITNNSGVYTVASTNLVHVDSQQPQGFINRTDSRISVSGNIFRIEPTGSSYSYYNKGIKVVKTSGDSLTIPNLTQINYIHFDTSNNQLSNKTTSFDFSSDIPIAYIAWNSGVGPSGQMTFFAEERHGIVMDTSTHKWIHYTFGAQYVGGLSIGNYVLGGNGSSNTHATISIGDGTLYQEDIEINITDSSSTDPFCQELSPIAQIPVYYHQGTTGQWVKNTATDYPVKYGANGPQYNLLSGGTWTTPDVSPGGATKYFAVWILATNQIDDPIISIMGQRVDGNEGAAENNNSWADVNLTNLPISEVKPLYRLIFAADSNSYTNVPKCRLLSILDIRVAVISTIAGVAQNDHGSLFGLGDDDHSQYLHVDNNRTVNAIHNFVNGLTVNGTSVSVSGHSHTSSNITDFNSSVSGILPVKNITGGSYTNVMATTGNFTISITGLQPSGSYATSVHTHSISDITGLQTSLDSKQPSGNYAASSHTHTASQITDLNSAVSGILPVKDIIAGSNITLSSSSGIYTINSTGGSSLANTVTGTGIGASTSGYLSRWINTSGINNSIIYQNANNIGIGTTSPQSVLHLADNNSTTWLTLENTNTGAGTTVGIVLKDIYASTPNSGLIYNDWSGEGLIFKTSRDLANSQGGFIFKGSDDTTRMVIRTNSNGNVGIGIASPSYKLDVIGSVRASGDAIIFNKIYGPITTGNAPNIQIGYGSSSRVDITAGTIYLNGVINQQDNFTLTRVGDATSTATQKDSYNLSFQNSIWNGSSNGIRNGATIKSTASTTVNDGTRLSFLINNGDNTGNSTERLCITSSGNVGIGTTTPSTLLDINNNKFRLRNSKTPTSPSDIGDAGDVCWDSNYIYVCVSSNTWKRTAITSQWSADAYFSYVSLLLHMNGSGSTFIDDGPFSKQVTAFGGATQSSAQSRFGGSSLQNSASRYLSINGGSEFNFGTGDFCVELWVFPTEAPSGNAVISNSYTDDNIVGFAIGFSTPNTMGESTGSSLFFGWYNNGWVGISTSSTLNINDWNHIAVSRTSNTTRLYLNGTQVGSSLSTPQLPDMTTLFIGRRWDLSGSTPYFAGYIDEVRITKGYNRNYTGSTITIPTSPFPDYNS